MIDVAFILENTPLGWNVKCLLHLHVLASSHVLGTPSPAPYNWPGKAMLFNPQGTAPRGLQRLFTAYNSFTPSPSLLTISITCITGSWARDYITPLPSPQFLLLIHSSLPLLFPSDFSILSAFLLHPPYLLHTTPTCHHPSTCKTQEGAMRRQKSKPGTPGVRSPLRRLGVGDTLSAHELGTTGVKSKLGCCSFWRYMLI